MIYEKCFLLSFPDGRLVEPVRVWTFSISPKYVSGGKNAIN